jgi:N-acetyl-D-muramate 6-phosphate phosphatase
VDMKRGNTLEGVLFDLDGTLLDTAPDLLEALNWAMQQHGYAPVAKDEIRPYISFGAVAMVRKSLSADTSETTRNRVMQTMLDYYQDHIAERTQLFDGMQEVLETLESRGIAWGVVTNKRKRFTLPLMDALQLAGRAACLVSGDSAAAGKPHPDPVLLACRQAGVAPRHCVFIGDSAHDIAAGKSAGTLTLAALYGYLQADDDPGKWGADGLVHNPREILPWLN